ncbi:MAG: glycosyltransferase [Planctomycetia bacterium]|nr:glycosyltransferase [Planctomycetia bacterium]
MSLAGKKLLLVVPSATSFLAFLAEVATAWRRCGGTVAVAAGPCLGDHASVKDGDAPWPQGVDRLPLPDFRFGSPTAMIRAAGRLRGHVMAWRPDIVHAHFTAAVFLAAMVRPFAGHPSPVWMGTFHGLHGSAEHGRRSGLVAAVERWSARRMTAVCVLNPEDRTALASSVGGVPIHVHASSGVGCDLDRFDAGRFSAADRDHARRGLGLSPDAFVLAFVGRQTAFKGFPAAVRAYRLVRDSGIDAALLVVGAEDSLHRSGLSAEERRGLENDPHVFRTGWRQDVSPCLAMADCIVLPSVREGMPVSLMEALAMGVPAITVDSRGCRDVVRDGVDGFVLPSCSPEDVARAATAIASDRRLREAMRAAAIAGRGRFDRRRYVTDQVALYAGLVGRRSGSESGRTAEGRSEALSG